MKLHIPQDALFLAPMAGVTDDPFRSLCAQQGADFCVTEMISAKGVLLCPFEREEFLWLKSVSPDEHALLQIFGSEPERMAEMARRYGQPPYVGIDLNFGCPAHKIVSGGDGSALLRDLPLAQRVVEAVVRASALPVTVKFRLGWDEQTVCYQEAGRRFEDAGAAALTLHARTRQQQYAGKADWEAIARLTQSVSIPVVGNGDALTPEAAVALLRQTGCRAVMIGRGAMGNPWIFAQTKRLLNGEPLVPVSPQERLDMAMTQARLLAAQKGERVAVREMRKHMAWYTKGLRGSAAARARINAQETVEEVERELRTLLEQA